MIDALLVACAGAIGVGRALEDGGHIRGMTRTDRRVGIVLFYLCLVVLLWRNL